MTQVKMLIRIQKVRPENNSKYVGQSRCEVANG